jgi:hypothetical protein
LAVRSAWLNILLHEEPPENLVLQPEPAPVPAFKLKPNLQEDVQNKNIQIFDETTQLQLQTQFEYEDALPIRVIISTTLAAINAYLLAGVTIAVLNTLLLRPMPDEEAVGV